MHNKIKYISKYENLLSLKEQVLYVTNLNWQRSTGLSEVDKINKTK